MPQIRSESRLEIGTADIDFRQRIVQPPQPRVSVEDGERRLSHTAVYAKSGSIDPNCVKRPEPVLLQHQDVHSPRK